MNITQSYVSLFFFFFLTWFLSARFKGISLRTQILSFLISAVFSILEVYIYLNSVLLVFLFSFLFFVFSFLGDKHGWLISEIRPWQDSCLKTTICSKNCANEDTLRTFPSEGHFPWPSTEAMPTLEHFLNGQCSARYPCLIRLHTRLPHMKRKKSGKKSLRNHMAI